MEPGELGLRQQEPVGSPIHRQIEHTADLALEVSSPSEPALLEESAQALVEIMTEGAAVSASIERPVRLDALDREDRLVHFLNEVIYLAVTEGFLVHSATLRLIGETKLEGKLVGAGDVPLAAELKAVTYHDLSLIVDESGARARFVVDV